jgi:hypothetical protein
MSDQIRSALSPKFGDEFDRIFGGKKCKYGDPTCPCQDGDKFQTPIAIPANNAVCVLGVATNTTNITISGFTAPAP